MSTMLHLYVCCTKPRMHQFDSRRHLDKIIIYMILFSLSNTFISTFQTVSTLKAYSCSYRSTIVLGNTNCRIW